MRSLLVSEFSYCLLKTEGTKRIRPKLAPTSSNLFEIFVGMLTTYMYHGLYIPSGKYKPFSLVSWHRYFLKADVSF